MTEVVFTIRLDMLSDWSVSRGGGRQGSLDSLIERDADGLPYVPATTLRGMWRDAAEQVAFGLDDGAPNGWCRLVDHLFGSQPAVDNRGLAGDAPIAGRLALADAMLPSGLRGALRGKKRARLRTALALVKPGVAIDPRSGRARPDFLRFEEVARQGAVLEAEAAIMLAGDERADEALVALAFSAARLIERIGGNRRRGSGRCAVTIDPLTVGAGLPRAVDDAVARVERIGQPKIPDIAAGGGQKFAFGTASTAGFVAIPLDVEINTPTVIADAVLGNVVSSLDYIPGTMLIAGVAQMFRNGKPDYPDLAAQVRSVIACGDIRVLPAYPTICGQRGRPTPLVFEEKKDDTGGPRNKGVLRNRLNDDTDKSQYKTLRGEYFAYRHSATAPAFGFEKTKRSGRTHNTVEDWRQKPTELVGGVYSYEAIAAGELLKSQVLIRESLTELLRLALAPVPINIGRAKKAGYGRVQLTPREITHLVFARGSRPGFILYAESDILLPAAPISGQDGSSAAFLAAAIRAETGRDVKVGRGDVRIRRTEGWIARWRLPRPSYVAIEAGSTVEILAADGQPLSDEQLDRLGREGLGLRRAEGFGRVLVDPDFLKADLRRSVALVNPGRDQISRRVQVEPELAAFTRRVESAGLREAVGLHAEYAARHREEELRWTADRPNMSQLGALRSMMAGLRTDDDFMRARSFIAAIARTDRAARWGTGEVDDNHPLGILRNLFNEPASIWRKIRMPESDWNDLLVTRDIAAAKSDRELQRFAIASFLAAAMLLHKRASEAPSRGVV